MPSRRLTWIPITLTVSGLGACATEPANGPTRAAPPAPPVVLMDGVPLDARELAVRAGEIAGGAAIEELVLERSLAQACRDAGILITDRDVDAERGALIDSVVAGAAGSAGTLLDRIRTQRGLGPVRFEALLRRNAMLRALVRAAVSVSDEEVRLAHAIRSGRRVEASLIVTPTRDLASLAMERVRANAERDGLASAFADQARRVSTHASASSGGDLGSVSLSDPAYPSALREQLAETLPGALTEPFAVGDAFGFALVRRVIDTEPPGDLTADERAAVRDEIRRRKERIEMERLAERLVRTADVQVLDPSLGWSFRTRTGRGG